MVVAGAYEPVTDSVAGRLILAEALYRLTRSMDFKVNPNQGTWPYPARSSRSIEREEEGMTGVEKITEPRYRQKKTQARERAVVKLRLEDE